MRPSLLVDELDEVDLSAPTSVGLGFFGALGEELDGWVAGDALLLGRSLGVLSFGINLGNEDAGLVTEVVGDLLPDWCEALAIYFC